MKQIILMNGFTGCYKSTITNHLLLDLSLSLISSHELGSASTSTGLPDQNLRNMRYERMLSLLKNNAMNSESCIVDFSFCHEDYLEKTIKQLQELAVQNIKIIRLISSNNKKNCKRIINRQLNKSKSNNESYNPRTLSIIQSADQFYHILPLLEKATTIMEFDVDNLSNESKIYGRQDNGIINELVLRRLQEINSSLN